MVENTNHEEMVECHYKGAIIHVPAKTFAKVVMELQIDGRTYVRYKEGAELFGMSERKFWELAEAADAVHRFGKVALVNLKEIEDFLKYCK